jgi:predicted Zn-dependent protease
LVGNGDESRRLLDQALPAETTPQGRADIAVTLAWLGDAARAQPLIDELTGRFPEATVIANIQLPTARAALALRHGSASTAIAQLQTVLPYDRAMPAGVRAIYLRGEAFLTSGDAAAAAAEFKKLTERRGRLLANTIFPLSHLALGRALAAAGDRAGATAAYAEFFKLWKDADPDLPVHVQARQEFAALRK